MTSYQAYPHKQPPTEPDFTGRKNQTAALLLVSILALFLELLLIRWIGTEINIFAYLQNTVLVVCFMGLGLGCLSCRQPIVLGDVLKPLLFLVLLLSVPITRESLGKISLLLSGLRDLVVWNRAVLDGPLKVVFYASLGLAATFGLMFFIAAIFVPLGRILGRLMDDHPRPIWAYSLNITGSLIGIWLFVLLGVFYKPPAIWFLLVATLLFFFIRKSAQDRLVNSILLMGIVAASWFPAYTTNSIEKLWSPYQKLILYELESKQFPFFITVNNTGFQNIIDFSSERTLADSPVELPGSEHLMTYYIPVLAHPHPRTVLIVGAGTGSDVAAALKRPSIEEITAVEIDPAIIYLGRQYHPEKPYDSPRVKVVENDARSFFTTSKQRYDIILLALLDSHTTTAMTNARLDHYVYTKESFEKLKSLLAEDGVVVVKFDVQEPFIAERLMRLLRETFDQEPMSYYPVRSGQYSSHRALFIVGNLTAAQRALTANNQLSSLLATWKDNQPFRLTSQTSITTDDWPYLYLRSRHIPLLYYFLALMIMGLFLYLTWRFKIGRLTANWNITHWHFFFLGAAFLLLEVQNISKASVVLGNTWWVNAVIISGILVMILLANFLIARFPTFPISLTYFGLIGSCIGLYFVDLAQFGFLPYYQKAVLIAVLTALPVLFSGLIFIRSFAGVTAKNVALGANFIGSLVGGLLQSITFITGIKTLLLIVAGLYGAALLCHPRRRDTF